MIRIFIKKIVQTPLSIYKYGISPLLPKSCRYHPTCSSYTHQAIEKHGVLKGCFLGATRILSCHPWSKKSYHDPVPEEFTWWASLRYKRGYKKDKTKIH